MARHNRSKAKTWLLKDRDNARRSHVESGEKTRSQPKHDSSKTEVMLDPVMLKAERKPGANQRRNSQTKVFPSHRCNSPKMMHSQSFSKIKQVSPLFDHFSQNSPPYWHMHTSSLKRPKAPPEAETPPESMLCNECNAGDVSESIHGYKDMSII